MIGVAVSPGELGTVREFFELFKTPWEPAVAGVHYRAVLSTVGEPEGVQTDLLIAYGSAELDVDCAAGVGVEISPGVAVVERAGVSFPLYRGAASFHNGGEPTLVTERGALDYTSTTQGRKCWRVGYDLFEEVRYLLTEASRRRMP